MTFVVFMAADGSEGAMFQTDNPELELLSKTVDGVPMKPIGMFSADNWATAKKFYEALMGFHESTRLPTR